MEEEGGRIAMDTPAVFTFSTLNHPPCLVKNCHNNIQLNLSQDTPG